MVFDEVEPLFSGIPSVLQLTLANLNPQILWREKCYL
jgi:hypothetical protein